MLKKIFNKRARTTQCARCKVDVSLYGNTQIETREILCQKCLSEYKELLKQVNDLTIKIEKLTNNKSQSVSNPPKPPTTHSNAVTSFKYINS